MQPQTIAQPRVVEVNENEVIIAVPRFLFKCEHEVGEVSDLSNKEEYLTAVKPTAFSE